LRKDSSTPSASVILILSRESDGDKILLTRRSSQLREHAGEVALPGGKRDPEDSSFYRTALRECYEEVGIPEHELIYCAEMQPHATRRNIGVVPFVAEVRKRPELALSAIEIESARWVPLELFMSDKRTLTHIFQRDGFEEWAPVYEHDDYWIWGFTARVLASFVNRFYGRQIRRSHPIAKEVLYTPKGIKR